MLFATICRQAYNRHVKARHLLHLLRTPYPCTLSSDEVQFLRSLPA